MIIEGKQKEIYVAEFREEYKDKDHCFCKKVCRFVCMMMAMIGISLFLYGCGRVASIDDTVSEETMLQTSEETGAEWNNDRDESSIREKTEPSEADSVDEMEIPLLEQLFTYDKVENSSEQYLVITRVACVYREQSVCRQYGFMDSTDT